MEYETEKYLAERLVDWMVLYLVSLMVENLESKWEIVLVPKKVVWKVHYWDFV
jgi:hypothetical protein